MALSDYKGVYVFAQTTDNKVDGIALELLGKGKDLAADLNTEVVAMLLGHEIADQADALAEYGADNCGADWKESAVKAAKSKQEYSRGTMINLLKNLGFTDEEAAYAADYYHK